MAPGQRIPRSHPGTPTSCLLVIASAGAFVGPPGHASSVWWAPHIQAPPPPLTPPPRRVGSVTGLKVKILPSKRDLSSLLHELYDGLGQLLQALPDFRRVDAGGGGSGALTDGPDGGLFTPGATGALGATFGFSGSCTGLTRVGPI